MGIILWIIFGALAGWIASVIMKTNYRQGTMADILMGILGSIVGGFLMGMVGKSGVDGFNLYSLLVAVIGAVVVIYVGRILRNRG
ncbi:hypothetical protein A2574_03275 [Candidatus Shapirobacteria bacterium RIFOXYD1_FULL_38_32]|uniref:Transglycosylase-associated protein n=3 Tax=Candidatus Shapironibacteriota TaxID=1752721 RepID=A0A0G0N011_9BACT|nr:MAG: Transglycosylase-associated protein [Candidatus Shapirobacteria bacterium GW2011_GWE2_38_30]KKQ90198.1 MAG: Transglycosylase-associated protein [Candidatus Shapirobacteria bacterium GW2011_GWE1_38_92]OGL56290.1 MAG: hypothetical protein A2195_00960 [Candidatus Shapirobacteria bacterium RIFOXYA1_FULL_39_17]OGL57387.1 MAG: hypothetical protein A2367_01685 [Candidatus Shapirobacteria bacterium RIFOXYB1_FULL_38_38]OGL58074.1 MAG: hypothetical protein A2574_03275 [Candidatus Shapirobacteria 